MNAAFSSTQRHMRVPNDGQRTQRPRAERTDPSCRVRLSNTARPASPLATRLWPRFYDGTSSCEPLLARYRSERSQWRLWQ